MAGLDMSKVRERLKKAQSSGGGNFEKIDYDKLYFKPKTDTTYSVRIVPNKLDKEFPFTEVETHNYNAFKKTIPTLRNWSEADPIVEFRQGLYDEIRKLEKDKTQDPQEVAKIKAENEAIAKSISPRTKYALPVIVRGQEQDGVKIWELGKTDYEAVLVILSDEDNGDITDVVDGTDLKVVGYTAIMQATKKPYTAVNITLKRKSSPLSEDADLVEKWLEEQKDPREVFKKYTAEELKELLRAYLFPEESEEDNDVPPAKTTFKKAPLAPAKAPKAVEPAEDYDDEDLPAPTEAKAPVANDDEDEEGETPPAKPAVAKASASKAIKAKQIAEDDDEEEDALSHIIPKTKTTVIASKPAKKSSNFAKLMDDDEED